MAAMTSRSPFITNLRWGQIEVEGQGYKDTKLFPHGSREWDWRELTQWSGCSIAPADWLSIDWKRQTS